MQTACLLGIELIVLVSALRADVQVVPTPQYLEYLSHSLAVARGGAIQIVIGPSGTVPSPKMRLAADFLRQSLVRASDSIHVTITQNTPSGAAIHLWNFAADPNPSVSLNLLDRQTLSDPNHWGQSYVVRSPDPNTMWALGSSDQGVLLAAMTLLQLVRQNSSGLEIPGVYVRDYPDFEYRAAADWLLNVEVNRWSMDRGQGVEAYRTLCKQKLDQALRYKVNMVLMDGFGWSLRQRFAGYADLMRDLNIYARARGIHLLFGGYGASYGITYQTGPLYEEGAYLGEVFKNRESYPDGPTYQCMGFPNGKKGVDPSILGSCRSNEELNRLKAEELRGFVEAVEPGALYIHHEDFGDFRETEKMWRERCARCRERWPNDSLEASDGGAGGLSHGYAALVRAINGVSNSTTGYDAARDCQIILISPVYEPDSPDPDDWAKVLELWRNIGKQLPRAHNVQAGFREVFPQKYGAERWTEQFNLTMRTAGLDLGQFLFFAGGADDWASDYSFTGVPAMNALFRGARTIYNGTGDFYREPMEIVSAEYSWNFQSTGFFTAPQRNAEAISVWRSYIFNENQPDGIFGAGKLYDRACNLLYGSRAGPIMAAYYRESAELPDIEIADSDRALGAGYLPMSWNRVYAVPSQWRRLALDSKTWGTEISNERYASVMLRMNINRKELHRRLARRWSIGADLNRKGAAYVRKALAANPLPESIEDLRFLEICFRVSQPLMESLVDYHTGPEAYFSDQRDTEQARARFNGAYAKAKDAQKAAADAFPHAVDPIGGDVGAIRRYTDILVGSIERMRDR
jgi:hypothetical protein